MTTAEHERAKEGAIPGQRLNRWLLALLVLQVGIFVVSRAVSSRPPSMVPQKLLADLDVKTVVRIKVVDANGKVAELARRAGRWVLASAGDYPTKKHKVSEVLGKLAAVTAGEPVADKRAHHRALEVADDKFERKVTLTREGKKPIEIFLGSSPALKRVHFRFAGKDPVYSAGELSTWDVDTTATTWVDNEYFKVDKKEIVAVSLRNEHGEISLTRGTGDDWVVAGLGPEDKVKKYEVDSLVGAASSMTFQEPVGEEIEPAFELDKPAAELTVITERSAPEENKRDDAAAGGSEGGDEKADEKPAEGDAASQPAKVRKTFTVKIGAKKGDEYYAKASTSTYVVLVGSWAAETLTKKKLADLKEEEKKKEEDKGEGTDEGPALPAGRNQSRNSLRHAKNSDSSRTDEAAHDHDH